MAVISGAAQTNGPRIESDGSSLNTSNRFTTGTGSTALWITNHLWTSNNKTTKEWKETDSRTVTIKGGKGNVIYPMLADAIDFPMVFGLGLMVLVPLMAF